MMSNVLPLHRPSARNSRRIHRHFVVQITIAIVFGLVLPAQSQYDDRRPLPQRPPDVWLICEDQQLLPGTGPDFKVWRSEATCQWGRLHPTSCTISESAYEIDGMIKGSVAKVHVNRITGVASESAAGFRTSYRCIRVVPGKKQF